MSDDGNVVPFTGTRRVQAAKLSERFGEVYVWPERDGSFAWGIEVRGLSIGCNEAYVTEAEAWWGGYRMLAHAIEKGLEADA